MRAVNVSVMGDRTGFAWAPMPEYNYVDKCVNAKLEKMKILPSEECTDADFVRRVYLDLTGIVPTAEQARAFLEDTAPSREKRREAGRLARRQQGLRRLLVQQVGGPAPVQLQDAGRRRRLGVPRVDPRVGRAEQAVRPVRPRADHRRGQQPATNPPVNYYRTLRETGKITEDVSQTFLGVRFNCNKCHDHPFERWTQNQYYQFGAFFARVAFKPGTRPGEEIVFNNYAGGEVVHPKTAQVMEPMVPYGAEPDVAARPRPRRTRSPTGSSSKDNPLFRPKSYANRVWSYFFGRGIIDPVDDIRASNPPVNPRTARCADRRLRQERLRRAAPDADDRRCAAPTSSRSRPTSGTRTTRSTSPTPCPAG